MKIIKKPNTTYWFYLDETITKQFTLYLLTVFNVKYSQKYFDYIIILTIIKQLIHTTKIIMRIEIQILKSQFQIFNANVQ